VCPPTPCREWRGSTARRGYGKVWRQGKYVLVHRWIYSQIHGEEIHGKTILHLCDNPACYRLDHLWAGTLSDNTRDAFSKGRQLPPRRLTKLTEEDVRMIRHRVSNGERRQTIADELRVSLSSVSHAANGYTWRNVT